MPWPPAEANCPLKRADRRIGGLIVFPPFVPFVGDALHEGVQFMRSLDSSFQVDGTMGVRIVLSVLMQAGANALEQCVSVGPMALDLVADAAIEIVAPAAFTPKGEVPGRQNVVYQLGHGAVNPLHHWAQLFAGLQISQGVVMIVKQCRYPGNESVVGIVIETIPEHRFCGFGLKGWVTFAATGGDEIDAVIAIPVFKTVFPLVELLCPG